MGIRSWFGLDRPEAPEPPRPGPPTTEQLLGALDAVEQQARAGNVPGVVLSRLLRVSRIVRQTLPRLANLGIGSSQGYSVMATATDYLPVAIGNYMRLPRDWADTRPISNGKSSVMLLVDQLDLLGTTMDKVYDAVCRADADAIIVHGAFLEQKFGHTSTGGSLGLDSPDPTPTAPRPSSLQDSPHAPAGSRQSPPPGSSPSSSQSSSESSSQSSSPASSSTPPPLAPPE